mmetsp:Transcript_30662/g.34417  ORF Transcript_30662/g.34417 Transcript_30662/m.34417 type:complete len:330 (+) Transcript_30662:66-1055(+)
MPPYASEQDSSHGVSTRSSNHNNNNNDNDNDNDNKIFRQNLGTVDASVQKEITSAALGISPSLSQDTYDTEASCSSSLSSRFDKLFDLNPCMINFSSGSAAPNFGPATSSSLSSSCGKNLSPSAVFKKRQCFECKKYCSKFFPYEVERATTSSGASLLDEEIDETLGSTTRKVYYHKKCAQIKQYRNEHYQQGGFAIVLKDLMDRFRAIEFIKAEQKRMKEETEEEEAMMRLKAAEEKECSRLEEEKNMESSKKKKKKKKRVTTKKFLKHVKNTFSASCKGTNGTTGAVIVNSYDYQEYLDIKTSRMYYSNGVITTWNKPESYKPYKKA